MRRAGSGQGSPALALVAAALGYFVDVYDIWLYSVLRVPSLKGLGFTDPDQIKSIGEMLLNWQMAGFILGAVGFGILSDKRGRLTVLFGSILVYSLANIANGFVHDVPLYAVCRFFAGFGLAGELGAGIALVSELVHKTARGWATTMVATMGVAGSVAAALFASAFDWRVGYFVGGGMGLGLLLLRLSVFESGMFEKVAADPTVRRGDFGALFRSREAFSRYLATILSGAPVWFFAGLFMTFSPELQKGLGIADPHTAAEVIMISAIGLTLGDVFFGSLSQIWRSRKKAFYAAFVVMTLAIAAIFLVARDRQTFFWLMFVAGLGAGYWAVFVTTSGETFGTNLRGTVAVTAPSFVRGLVIPLTLGRNALVGSLGLLGATAATGLLVLGLAVWAVARLPETYARELDFVEQPSA
ncbi:MAG: MFS transporter [Fimbriimonadaceae bacterium]|nr:MFS transporter [Fimbriimonadaceae bacterium]QYK56425.1 MAG: MFS transporter [Fimbriimonadaceae bacterium]